MKKLNCKLGDTFGHWTVVDDTTFVKSGHTYVKVQCKCAITGKHFDSIDDASLDRIDSTKGYIEGNVQWTTYQANVSKHTMTMDELYQFCKDVLNHANQQPSQPLTKLEGSETND